MVVACMNGMAGYMCKRLVRAMCGDFIFYLFQRTGCPELIQERLRAAANAPVDETLYENQIPTGQRHQQQNAEQRFSDNIPLRNEMQKYPLRDTRGRRNTA